MDWRPHDVQALRRTLPWLGLALLAVLAVDAYVPLSPFMPHNDVDGSWILALNQAVARGLVFGRDIVFTFGPYASVFTHTYDPATATRMFAGSALLAAVVVACLAVLLRRRAGRWPAGACLAFFLLLGGTDSLLLALPLLVTLTVLSWLHGERPPRWALPVLVLAWISFGLLPLVKGTLALLCAVAALISAAALLQARRIGLAALSLACPLAALGAFWCAAGQALPDLPGYLLNMREIVSGYSEGMAVKGPSRELWLFGLPALLLLAALASQGSLPRGLRLGALAITAVFLFLSFKAGFVRHDVHAQIALANLVAALGLTWPLLPPAQYRSRWLLVALAGTALLCGGNAARRATDGRTAVGGATSNPLVLRTAGFDASDWPRRYAERLRLGATHCGLDGVAPVDTDVYSFDQFCLLAQGLPWNPRPVLQSYSAYTPALARLNEAHLRGPSAPRQLLYRLQTIDERLPAMDDGLSLPALLDNYEPAQPLSTWLVLKARPQRQAASRYDAPVTLAARLGEPVAVPAALPLFTEIVVRPTWAGRLRALLYKPPPLSMRVTLADGTQATYRVNAGMMETGFVLSPLLATTADVAALFDGRIDEHRGVRELRIDSASPLPFWQAEMAVTFRRLHTPAPAPSALPSR